MQALRPAPSVQTRVQTQQMMRSMVEAGEGLAIVDPFTALGARSAGLDVCPLSPAVPICLYALTFKPRAHRLQPIQNLAGADHGTSRGDAGELSGFSSGLSNSRYQNSATSAVFGSMPR
jgi:DNA-binding transcriptional LysR family regulator